MSPPCPGATQARDRPVRSNSGRSHAISIRRTRPTAATRRPEAPLSATSTPTISPVWVIRICEAVPVEYAKTVRELNANALHDWFEEFGDEFGWSRLFDVDDLQSAANDGDLCILVAQRLDLNRSGHIVAILPETDVIKAERKGGRVVQPIESQAGETNHVAIVKDSPWWANEARFRSFGLWRHS
jgi:hypothetical protein